MNARQDVVYSDGDMNEFVYRQVYEMNKEKDRFIFSQFSEYLGQRFKLSETHIPVELIERMFICFTREHREEFDEIMKRYNS